MSMRFDDIAKGLAAEQISRRQAVGKIAAGLAGALLPEGLASGASATIFCFPGEHSCRGKCCTAHERCCKGANRASCCKHGEHCYKGLCIRHGKCPPHRRPCGTLRMGPGPVHKTQVCCGGHEKCCVYEKTGRGTCINKNRKCCPQYGSAAGPLTCPPHTVCAGSPDGSQLGCCTTDQVVCGGACCDPGYKCCLGPDGNGGCCDPMTGPCCIHNGAAYCCIGSGACGPDVSCPFD